METNQKMPVLFVGHGSPMNAIEQNAFTQEWEGIATLFPKPKAILCISAHWYTDGTRILDDPHPKLNYDMYGFPQELYDVKYPALGAPELAQKVMKRITRPVITDNSWGLDHGCWSVLCRIFPKADIPVTQLSVDKAAPAKVHFAIGQELRALREEGVLIVGSGNVVHNLSQVDWTNPGGYPWAKDFDNYIREGIQAHDFERILNYQEAGEMHSWAVPHPDHIFPLLYVLGAADKEDAVTVLNQACVLGSLSMTSYLIGAERK